jgi:hypothetical protein
MKKRPLSLLVSGLFSLSGWVMLELPKKEAALTFSERPFFVEWLGDVGTPQKVRTEANEVGRQARSAHPLAKRRAATFIFSPNLRLEKLAASEPSCSIRRRKNQRQ